MPDPEKLYNFFSISAMEADALDPTESLSLQLIQVFCQEQMYHLWFYLRVLLRHIVIRVILQWYCCGVTYLATEDSDKSLA